MADNKLIRIRHVREADEILPPEPETIHLNLDEDVSLNRYAWAWPAILEQFEGLEFSVLDLHARHLSVELIKSHIPYPWMLVYNPTTMTYRFVKVTA